MDCLRIEPSAGWFAMPEAGRMHAIAAGERRRKIVAINDSAGVQALVVRIGERRALLFLPFLVQNGTGFPQKACAAAPAWHDSCRHRDSNQNDGTGR